MSLRRALDFLLAGLGRLASRRPGPVLAGALLLTCAAAWPAARTLRNIDYNLLDVLTAGHPRAEAYKRIGRDFGIIDRHFLVVELRDRADLPAAKELADRLAEAMSAEGEVVRSARSRLDLRGFVTRNACLYLNDEIAEALAGRFSDEGLQRAMERNAGLLAAGVPRQAVEADPLGLVDLVPMLAGRKGAAGVPISLDGHMVSGDGLMVLVAVTPLAPASNNAFAGRLMERTREAVRKACAEHFAGERAGLASRLNVEICGAYASGEQHARLLLHGIALSWLSALLGPLLMFAIPFRRPLGFLFVGVPLVLPAVWTLALAPLLLGGRISIIGGAFATVLLGLGIDFAVLLYNRYAAERAAGCAPERAAELSVGRTGEGIVIGGLTMVAAFAGMALTHFRGFVEFGTLAALGVFLTMVGLLLAVPAGLVLLERRKGPDRVPPRPVSLGLPGVWRLVRGCPTTIVAAVLTGALVGVVALAALPGNRGVRFESDFAAIGPPAHIDTTGVLNKRVNRAFGMADREALVLLSGRNVAEVRERTAAVKQAARGLVESGRLAGSRGILDLVPAPAAQEHSLELARGRLLPLLETLPARWDRAATAAGFRPGSFAAFARQAGEMAENIRRAGVLEVEHLDDPAVAELAALCFRPPAAPGGAYRTLSFLSLPDRPMESGDYAALAADLGIDGKTAVMTNHMLVTYELRDSVRDDLLLVTAIVLAAVAGMIWFSLRRPVLVALAMSPPLIGALLLLLIMKLCGLSLNYINVLVFPILIGLGVDSAINLIIRVRQDGDIGLAVTDTGRALVICAATSMWGFFSLFQPLMSPPHWGLRSLGLIVTIGLALALAVSLTFVPAALILLQRRAERKGK